MVIRKKIASLDLFESIERPALPKADLDQWQPLSMTNVEYAYPESGGEPGFALGPINFHLNKGELLFIVGGNGSGKSIFARLLTSLYAPSSGSVSFNGMTVNEKNINDDRQYFSVVLSDFFLFERLRGNEGKHRL